MTPTFSLQFRVYCSRCAMDLTHRVSVVDGSVKKIRVPPCDSCIGESQMAATKKADKEIDKVEAALKKFRDAPPQA